MGRNNWRLYVVIIMALLAFNGFTGLFVPRTAGSGSCGSVIMPTPKDAGSGFHTLSGPSFSADALECPNTIIRANIEVFASLLAVAGLSLGLLLSRKVEQRESASEPHSHLPPPPSQSTL